MDKEKDNIVPSPWAGKSDQPWLLEDFLVQLREYLAAITSIPQEIRAVAALFAIGQKPVPGHYEAVITLLATLDEPIQAFCALLDTTTKLPLPVIALRYPLTLVLHSINEQIYVTSMLIGTIDTTCHISSKQVRQHQALKQRLASLALSYDEVIHHVHHLLDQAQFEERRLTRSLEFRETNAGEEQTNDNDRAQPRIIDFMSAQQHRSGTKPAAYSPDDDQ